MNDKPSLETRRLKQGADIFDVLVIAPEDPRRVVVFAAGRGGSPLRHEPLLRAIAGFGCRVVAPYFEMMASPVPSASDLQQRLGRLVALDDDPELLDLPLVGLGHSIGCVALLILAGAQGRTLVGECVDHPSRWNFTRLALLAPPTDFFRHPGALDQIQAHIQVWAGAKDPITPPSQALFLKAALTGRVPIHVHLNEDPGHFTYMDELPPNMTDPHPDRRAFLASLAVEIGRFITI